MPAAPTAVNLYGESAEDLPELGELVVPVLARLVECVGPVLRGRVAGSDRVLGGLQVGGKRLVLARGRVEVLAGERLRELLAICRCRSFERLRGGHEPLDRGPSFVRDRLE